MMPGREAALCKLLQIRQHRLNLERCSQQVRHRAALSLEHHHQTLRDEAIAALVECEAAQSRVLRPGSRTFPTAVLWSQERIQASRAQLDAAEADLTRARAASAREQCLYQDVESRHAALQRRAAWWSDHFGTHHQQVRTGLDQRSDDDVQELGVRCTAVHP